MRYIMTSNAFTGQVEFDYNETTGLMISYSTANATLSETQQVWLLKNLPRELAEAQTLLEKNPNILFKPEDVTFEMFWQAYDDKINSSRKRTLKAWEKMTKDDQVKAFRFMKTYFRNIPQGTRKKYAETYLNAELWNN
jgi:hypothetical protein